MLCHKTLRKRVCWSFLSLYMNGTAHRPYELHGILGLCMYYYFRYDDHDDHASLTRLDTVMTMYLFLLGFPGQLGFHLFAQVARARGFVYRRFSLSSVRVEGRQEYYGFLYSLLATSRDSLAIA